MLPLLMNTMCCRLLTITLVAGLVTLGHATPGDLDTTFNGNGKVTTTIGGSDDRAYGMVLQGDGGIIVVGSAFNGTNDDIAIVRYLSNGGLDTTFNTTGKVTTAVGSGGDYAQSVALQSDGKIVVAGYADVGGLNNDVAVLRYNPDGSLDTSFNTSGKVTTPIGLGDDRGYSVSVQGDGKIVVAGFTHNGSNLDIAVLRYLSNGSLDNSFDTDGRVTTAIGTADEIGFGMAIQTDGKIIVSGYTRSVSNFDFAVVRYNINGSLDTSFDADGKVSTTIGSGHDYGAGIALQTDGKILVTGYGRIGSNDQVALVRYNVNGSLDTSFNTNGKVTTPIGTSDSGRSVKLQSDGKIVVAAISDNDIALLRYNADGSLDPTFSGDGKVKINFGSQIDLGYSLVVQKDGKLVISGITQGSINYACALVRFWAFEPQESWRLGHFGIMSNTGDAANDFDFDKDGLANLVEYAFSLDPTLGTSLQLPVGQISGGSFATTFSTPVGVSGITYAAEWSTTLTANDWQLITDTGNGSQHIFSVPVSGSEHKFVRLVVTSP